jgi:hypothetical protein
MQARTAALAAQAPAAPVETPPEVMERRRKGLSDYEKPPLGQPPSWLQEQEKIAEPVQCSSAGTAEAIRTATLWFEQQIENAQQDQISGFRSGPQVRGERALARHFALYEAQQVFLEATRTFSGPQTLSTPEGGK